MQASIDARWDDVGMIRSRESAGRATLRHAADVRAARTRMNVSLADDLVPTSEQGEAVVLGAIATAARRAGVVITSVEPSSDALAAVKGPFRIRPIAIGVRGAFSELLAFLAGVNDSHALFEIRDIALSPARSSAGRKLLLEMRVSAAVYRATSELGKEQ